MAFFARSLRRLKDIALLRAVSLSGHESSLMPYLIMTLAVVCFTAQFAFTKCYEKSVSPSLSASLVMVILTNLAGTLLYLCIGGFRVEISTVSLLWALVFAAVTVPYYTIGIKILSLGNLAVYSMFMMLGGMLVPSFYGTLFLSEEPTLGRILGTVLLTIFIILQALWQKPNVDPDRAPSKKETRLFFILCLVIFFLNGMTGVIAKAHEINGQAVDPVSFTVLSCTATALLALLLLPFSGRHVGHACRESFRPRPLLVMLFLGAAAYTGNFLHLIAAEDVPASVQFPLVSGGVIVLSAVASHLIFREKLSKKEWISVGGSLVATVLFAF